MSFKEADVEGKVYAPGYFLADNEKCTRETRQIAQSGATTVGAAKVVKAGTPYPSNDSSCKGIVYEDVDVTSGDMPGSVVTQGVIFANRLPVALDGSAKSALVALGWVIYDSEPTVTRPY